MAQPKVFVSHSHVDDAFAERFVKDLRAAGVDAWLDKTDLGAGDFQARINAALGDCEWFVLVLTRSALASEWVKQEVNAANRLKHQGRMHDLIFIQAGPVAQSELPALWDVYNIFDAIADYAAALNSTLKAAGITLSTAPESDDNDITISFPIDSPPSWWVSPSPPKSDKSTEIPGPSQAAEGAILAGLALLQGCPYCGTQNRLPWGQLNTTKCSKCRRVIPGPL